MVIGGVFQLIFMIIMIKKYKIFNSKKIELLSGEIVGKTESLSNGFRLMNTPFISQKPKTRVRRAP